MKNAENVNNDITNGTKQKSTDVTWIIIGGEKKWIRNCPDCKKSLEYSFRSGFDRANKRNSRCNRCNNLWLSKNTNRNEKTSASLKGREFSIEHRQKLSEASSGENNQMYGKTGNLNPFYGKKHSIETKTLIGKQSKDRNTGKKLSPDLIRKLRLLSIERKKKLGIFNNHPFYNPFACRFMDNFGKTHGYNFQHAQNGGEYHISELGYWIDGYDKSKNVIFEYNEPHHYDIVGNLKQKDIRRIHEIKNLLKCSVIIYNGHTKSIDYL